MVDWGRGMNDGFHGGNPLQVVNRPNGVDWRGVCETRWWWVQWVKMAVAVMVFIPGGSCGRAGSREIAWQLGTAVTMVAVAERAPRVLCA